MDTPISSGAMALRPYCDIFTCVSMEAVDLFKQPKAKAALHTRLEAVGNEWEATEAEQVERQRKSNEDNEAYWAFARKFHGPPEPSWHWCDHFAPKYLDRPTSNEEGQKGCWVPPWLGYFEWSSGPEMVRLQFFPGVNVVDREFNESLTRSDVTAMSISDQYVLLGMLAYCAGDKGVLEEVWPEELISDAEGVIESSYGETRGWAGHDSERGKFLLIVLASVRADAERVSQQNDTADFLPMADVADICKKSPSRISQLCKEDRIACDRDEDTGMVKTVSLVSAQAHFAKTQVKRQHKENAKIARDARGDTRDVERDDRRLGSV